MANDKTGNEPQSYGSDKDWVTGKTGQQVNDPKAPPPNSQHGDFYESRHDSERSGEHQGGKVSGEQLAENAQPPGQAAGTGTGQATGTATETDDQPARKVGSAEGGAVRDSFFKDRDYK
jgi:hypothetical protein